MVDVTNLSRPDTSLRNLASVENTNGSSIISNSISSVRKPVQLVNSRHAKSLFRGSLAGFANTTRPNSLLYSGRILRPTSRQKPTALSNVNTFPVQKDMHRLAVDIPADEEQGQVSTLGAVTVSAPPLRYHPCSRKAGSLRLYRVGLGEASEGGVVLAELRWREQNRAVDQISGVEG
ncbi:hypothetical protein DL765_011165 [Monosporascus sp. GIB2]|nr:hypothetical protein DL765_011165 [Monosporascus sp. GIB2]